MLVDAQTTRELEIFRSRDGGPGVFHLLDMTRTDGGREALRQRFEHTLTDAAAIRETQADIRFLIDKQIEFTIEPDLLKEVLAYFASSWVVASRQRNSNFFLESLWVAVRYGDLLRDARRGLAATRILMYQVRDLAQRVVDLNPPPALTRLAQSIDRLVSHIGLANGNTGYAPWSVLRADWRLREKCKKQMRAMLAQLNELDALCSMAMATQVRGLKLPELVESERFMLEGKALYHPFVQDAVRNPIDLGDSGSFLLLTGPNMSGKTTCLKAIGIATYLAHLGMGVPCESFRFTLLHALYSSFAPEDNVRAGISFFMAEVRRVRDVVEALVDGKHTLVLFDEIFKGTNVKDAVEATRQVILGMTNAPTSGFLVSSHLIELAQELEQNSDIRFGYFDAKIEQGQPQYSHTIRSGVSSERFGLHILKQEGVSGLLELLNDKAERE